MSSSVVAESSGSQKTENTVIIFVNNDGSFSVDEQTLQKLLVSNQQNAAVSVVRVGDTQKEDDAKGSSPSNEEPTASTAGGETQPEVNLTVEGFFPPSATEVALPADPVVVGADSLVDPFLEMDPEQLERLETALQSEQAKQILGEGVTAMLDMLTADDDQTSTLKDSIRMDHCYTTSCGKDSLGQPGPSGSSKVGETTSRDADENSDSQEHEDEEETESEEELDSEEEAKRKRSRARGRARGNNVRSRGGPIVRGGKARVRGGTKRTPPVTPVKTTPATPVKTTPAVAKATTPAVKTVVRGGLTLQQQQHLQQLQQLKSIPVVKLSAPMNSKQPLQVAQIQSLLRAAAISHSGSQSPSVSAPITRTHSQPVVPTAVAVAEQSVNEKKLEEQVDAKESKEDIKPKLETSLSEEATSSTQQPEANKGKKKPVAIAAHKPNTRRSTIEMLTSPKEEQKSPKTRRTSTASTASTEETSPKKTQEVVTSPEVTTEVGAARKMYPKRENRKPPAHLAEAFGPALFSTPDIPRRISDAKAPEHKPEVRPAIDTKHVSDPDVKQEADLPQLPTEILAEDAMEPPEADSKEMLAAELQAVLGEIDPGLLEQMQQEADQESHEEKVVKTKAKVKSEPTTSTPKGKGTATAKRRRSSATKSKTEDSPVAAEKSKPSGSGRENKRGKGLSKVTVAAIRELQAPSDEDERQEAEEDDDESYNSEDDPDRLWCICRKPHNNRFMICCDVCEEWFHGVCVGITKLLGMQMEEKGQEWTCPECAKTKQQEQQVEKAKVEEGKKKQSKGSAASNKRRGSAASSASSETSQASQQRRKSVSDDKGKSAATTPADKTQAKAAAATVTPAAKEDGVMCIVCKKVQARSASVYCSQECILKHASEAINVVSKPVSTTVQPLEKKVAASPVVPGTPSATPATTQKVVNMQPSRVILMERKTGKLLTGTNAPTIAELKTWLQKHPTYEVVTPGLLNSLRAAKALKTGSLVLKAPVAGSKQTLLKLATPVKIAPAPATPTSKSPVTPAIKSPTTPTTPGTPKTSILVPAQRLPTPATKAAPSATNKPPHTGKTLTVAKTTIVSPAKIPKTAAKAPAATKAPVAANKTAGPKASTTAAPSAPAQAEKVERGDEEPRIRINVRSTLKDLLQSRVLECDDLKVNDNEVTGIASNIEEELHALFKDTGAKYKSKYRSLLFNIKDPKNLALFRKIVTGEVSPHRLVRLSPEELATKELAQWREREAQHTLDMIKKNELELMNQSITYVMKTHKGEQLIETDDSLKLQALAVEAETAALEPATSTVDDDTVLNSNSKSLDKPVSAATDKHSSKSSGSGSSKHSRHHKEHSSSSSSHHNKHDKHSRRSSRHSSSSSRSKSHKDSRERSSRDSKKESKDKERHNSHSSSHRHSTDSHSSKHRHHSEHSETSDAPEKEKSSSRSSSSLSKSSGTHKHYKSSSKNPTSTSNTPPQVTDQEPEIKTINLPVVEEEPQEPISLIPEPESPPEDADLSDREQPSSTVIIKTPDSNAEDTSVPYLWSGSFFGAEVVNFSVTAHEVSGNAEGLQHELSGSLEIVGRIEPKIACDYISKTKKAGTKEIVVVRFNATSIEERGAYMTYYSYLSNRVRFGVVRSKSTLVRDYYVMPLSKHAPIPQVLLPLDGPGFEESRPSLLLGIIVTTRHKRSADVAGLPSAPAARKEVRHSGTDRSYTPPLPEPRESGSYTPPLPPRPVQGDMPYSPGGSPDAPSPSGELQEQKNNYTSELEELTRKIEEEKQQIQNMSSELVSSNSNPGDTLQVSSLLQTITQTQALLATSVPGLSQLVVQTDVQTKELTTTIQKDDENEAYSPSRSITPPPASELNSKGASSTFSLPDTSNISLPFNLQEILASIHRKDSSSSTVVNETSTTAGVLSLESDPIVREYASADEPVESTTPPLPVPAPDAELLRSNQPPIVVPERSRDPRKPPEPTKKSLSKLTEDELMAMAQAQEIPEPVPAVVPIMPPLPPIAPIFFPPPPIAPMHVPLAPPGVLPVVLPTVVEQPTQSPPVPGTGDWHGTASTASKEEAPRKGISFRVEKRAPQPRWCRSASSDKKASPKRSATPPHSPPNKHARTESSD